MIPKASLLLALAAACSAAPQSPPPSQPTPGGPSGQAPQAPAPPAGAAPAPPATAPATPSSAPPAGPAPQSPAPAAGGDCLPPGNFTLNAKNLYPENADFDPETCTLYLSALYDASIVAYNVKTGEVETLSYDGIEGPDIHASGIQFNRERRELVGVLNHGRAFDTGGNDTTGDNTLVRQSLVRDASGKFPEAKRLDFNKFAKDAKYRAPQDIEFDDEGNVYVVATYEGALYRINKEFDDMKLVWKSAELVKRVPKGPETVLKGPETAPNVTETAPKDPAAAPKEAEFPEGRAVATVQIDQRIFAIIEYFTPTPGQPEINAFPTMDLTDEVERACGAGAAKAAGDVPSKGNGVGAAEGKAAEGKAAEGKAAEGKAAEGKAAQGKAAEGKDDGCTA